MIEATDTLSYSNQGAAPSDQGVFSQGTQSCRQILNEETWKSIKEIWLKYNLPMEELQYLELLNNGKSLLT